MAFVSSLSAMTFLLSRILFAFVVGFLALGNLRDFETSVAYADHKGVPFATITVPIGSLGLLAGALSILTGVYPVIGALAIVGILLPITITMHDFWTMTGQDRQNEQIHFLKNIGLIGGALVFLALASVAWPLAIGFGG